MVSRAVRRLEPHHQQFSLKLSVAQAEGNVYHPHLDRLLRAVEEELILPLEAVVAVEGSQQLSLTAGEGVRLIDLCLQVLLPGSSISAI